MWSEELRPLNQTERLGEYRMNYSRKDLKIVEHDFVSVGNRLLQSVVDDFPQDLKIFLSFIDSQNLIKEYIYSCGEPNADLKAVVSEVAGSYGRVTFRFGDTVESEVIGIYDLLKYLDSVDCRPIRGVIMSYASGSKHYDDMLRNFNSRITALLINHIDDYLTDVGIKMGMDENKTFNINVQDGGIAQLNIAQDNGTVTAQQKNTAEILTLKKAIKDLKDNAIDLSDEDRDEVFECTDIIEEEMTSEKPKKSVVRIAYENMKSIASKVPQAVEFAAAIAQIAGVLQQFGVIRI